MTNQPLMKEIVNQARLHLERAGVRGINGPLTANYPDGVAMEFEVELSREKSIPDYNAPGWVVKGDGSLRNLGIEYVSPAPVVYKVGVDNLGHLFDKFKELEPVIEDKVAARTGFHVHTNIMNRTLVQTLTTITTYWLIESVVSSCCGSLREGSLFCLRAKDAPGQVNFLNISLINARRSKKIFENFSERELKYAGLNLYTMIKFGSLEFRLMKGLFDEELQQSWLKMCNDLTYNLPFNTPSEMMDAFWNNKENPIEFMKLVLGDNKYLIKHISKSFDEKTLNKEMLKSAFRLLNLCYLNKSTDDWNSWVNEVYVKESKRLRPNAGAELRRQDMNAQQEQVRMAMQRVLDDQAGIQGRPIGPRPRAMYIDDLDGDE